MRHSPYFAQSTRFRWLALLGAVIVIAVGLRAAGVGRPLVGPFATKNAVYAMIARNWAEGRASWAYPTLDCRKAGERSLHMLELPVAAYVAGLGWRVCGGSLDAWGRGQAVFFSLASIAVLFAFVRRRHGPIAGAMAAAALALSPISMIYGQSFMLEASLVFFLVAAFAALDRWLDGRYWVWLPLLLGCVALTLMTKIYAAVFLLPMVAMIAGNLRSRPRRAGLAAAALLLALIPAGLWCLHAARTAAPGSPLAARTYYSLRDSADVHRPPHPLLFAGSYYRRLLDDLAGAALTPIGAALLALGLVQRAARRYLWWLAAAAALVLLLPRKFYEMNYYWMAVLPVLCIVIGLGGQRLVRRRVLRSPGAAAVAIGLTLAFCLRYAAGPLWTTRPEDRGVVAAGEAAQRRLAAAEPVIAMHGTSLDLLYYCGRSGWALDAQAPDLSEQVAACRREGVRWLVVAGKEEQIALPRTILAQAVERGPGFAVYRLPAGRDAE